MAWQDELDKLDKDLSLGRVRPDEYRRRRDELLASASSTPVVHRRNQRQNAGSIANAFTGGPAPVERDAEVTQQVALTPEQKAGWQAAHPDTPQIIDAPASLPAAPMHGSEIFSLSTTSVGKPGPRWPRFVIAVLVLALIAGATWWFAFRSGDEPAAANAQQQTSATDGQFTIDMVPIPVADTPLSTSGVLSVDQAQIYGLIVPDEANYLVQGGAEKIFYRWAGTSTMNYAIFAVQTRDSAAASRLAGKMIERGKQFGLQPAAVPDLPSGVTAAKAFGPKQAIGEAVYTSGRMAVRIVMVQTGPNNEHLLETATQKAVASTVRTIPLR
jgi:hypothetical protein